MPLLRKALGLESATRLTEPAIVPGDKSCAKIPWKATTVWLTCNVCPVTILVVIVAARLRRQRSLSKCYKKSLEEVQDHFVPGAALPQREHLAQSAEPINQYMGRV